MDERYKVIDFARIIGCGVKTVYRLIDDGRIKTVKDIENGRTITFIVANEEEISDLIRNYQKNSKTRTENDTQYYDNVTENDTQSQNNVVNNLTQSEIIDRIMTFSEGVNEQLITLNNNYNKQLNDLANQLIEYKSKIPLLEDKAGREGLYLQEISDIKSEMSKKLSEKDKEKNRQLIIFSVIILFFMIITLILSWKLYENIKNPTIIEKINTIETIREATTPVNALEIKNTNPAM